jgi:hypothetical protein
MRMLWVVALIACRAKAATLAVDARGTLVPGGAQIAVQTEPGAKVSIEALDQEVTADASGRAVIPVAPANVEKVLDAEVSAKVDDRVATAKLRFPPGIYSAGTKFRCLGEVACSGTVVDTVVSLSAPAGTVVRIGGSELKVDPQHDKLALDPVAVADRVGLTAVVGIKSVAAPVEIVVPKGPTLKGTVAVPADVLAQQLAHRLAVIDTQPLTRRDASTRGAVLVMRPESPDAVEGWSVRSIAGAEHPRSAKVVILAHPIRGRQACGKARDPKTRQVVALGFDVIDLELASRDPATGELLKTTLVKASRRCPPRTRPIVLASYDEHAADKAAEQLAK